MKLYNSYLIFFNFLFLYSCMHEPKQIKGGDKAILKLSTNDSLFPNCKSIAIDTSRLKDIIDQKGTKIFFGEDIFYGEKNSEIKTRVIPNEKLNGFDYLVETFGQVDTIFTFKIKIDSLYIWEDDDNAWEFKIRLSKNKLLNSDKVLQSRISYFYTSAFDNTNIKIFHVLDVNNYAISHYPKSEKIKINEFYFNVNDKLIAMKYKCHYYYSKAG